MKSGFIIGLIVGILVGFAASELHDRYEQRQASRAQAEAEATSSNLVLELLEKNRAEWAEARRLEAEKKAAEEAAYAAEFAARIEATDAYVKECLKRLEVKRDNFEINSMIVHGCRKEFWTKQENQKLAEKYMSE
jgi:hypothetical protein